MKYYSFNQYLRDTFGCKVYKISINAGFTCPNRDGTLGENGCIFCSRGGSGDFAESAESSITEQIESGKKSVAYSCIFRAADRSLTGEEIDKVFGKIMRKLEAEAGAQLR